MTWTNVLVPVLGGESDARMFAIAKALAEPFDATISAVFASMSPNIFSNWAGEAGVGPTGLAVAELVRSTELAQALCRDLFAALDYPRKAFETVYTDDWLGLRTASRLADVVVWERSAARGHGFFASAFPQILLDERRPALVTDTPSVVGGTVAIAWDGGREASRAVRRAVPLLRHADQVVLLTTPHTTARPCDASRALSYLADHGVKAVHRPLPPHGEAGSTILQAADSIGACLLVAGAFGHPRLQRFIFGGTTQLLIEGRSTALFLSH